MSNLKDEQAIVDALKKQFGDKLLEAKVEYQRRIHVKVADPNQLDVISFAMENWNSWHLIAVSSLDTPDEKFAVVYHYDIRPPFGGQTAITMNLMVECPDRKNPKITSMTKVLIGAQYFEREAHDLMGIVFEGHPDLSRLILPEDFPEGVYPLRKDFLLEIQKAELEKKKT